MFRAGVFGRILPHPSTVQRIFVRTSLVNSVMEGFIISLGREFLSLLSFRLSALSMYGCALLSEAAAMFRCHSEQSERKHWRELAHFREKVSVRAKRLVRNSWFYYVGVTSCPTSNFSTINTIGFVLL